jgi:alpha-beta hydrolase superfamily lysophospholipase
MKLYKEHTYWKKYLPFLPKKYQDNYVEPEELFWNWETTKVHYDFKYSESNSVNVILLHGAGGNGRILSLLGNTLFENGINYFAPDNLGYGLTQINKKDFDYNDWVNMINDFTNFILEKHKKPVVLFGMSVGGMLAYQVAAKNKKVRGLIATTLIDPRNEETMIHISKNKFLGKYGLKLIKSFASILDSLRLPVKWVCKIDLMSRNPTLSKIFIKDKLSGGTKLSMKFLRTFSDYKPEVSFNEFDLCPILLVHPEKDDWTPFNLSERIFNQLKAEKEAYLLSECGHAPIEEPGIFEMEKHIVEFINKKIIPVANKIGFKKQLSPKYRQ